MPQLEHVAPLAAAEVTASRWRPWIIAALVVHFATRVWSFAYFIPLAIKFQNVDAASQPRDEKKYQWVKMSRWRVLLGGAVLLMLTIAIVKIVG